METVESLHAEETGYGDAVDRRMAETIFLGYAAVLGNFCDAALAVRGLWCLLISHRPLVVPPSVRKDSALEVDE